MALTIFHCFTDKQRAGVCHVHMDTKEKQPNVRFDQ